MNLICPECKNNVNLNTYVNLSPGQVVECQTCGISLLINTISGTEVSAEVVDEGK